jgi:hypothetical protein
MSLPSNFPGEKSYCIVVGGDINDPDQKKLSLLKVHDPLRHSSEITPDMLPHIGTERNATQPQLEQFCAPPEQGTTVIVSANRGDPSSRTVVGMITEEHSAENVGGNSGLYGTLDEAKEKSAQKRVKPQVVERMVDGALVREMQEKGKDWMHSLTKGLATHAAWHPMAGQLLKEVKNIETALQNFANIPNAGALGQLPGSIMSIASIFKGLSNNQRKQATQNMSPNLVQGLDNMMLLMGDNISNGTDYVSSDRINPEVFTQNMIDLLSQVDNISDLIDAIHRLQYDETLRGMEQYAKQAYSGLTANSVPSIVTDEDTEVSNIILSDIVDNSIHYFDEGYSLNIASQTYVVVTADQTSNTITVFPRIEEDFNNAQVNVYLPVYEYETEGPYGPMTMTMDTNGNISQSKNSSQNMQQAMQAIQGLMSSAEAGKKFLFGDASGIMSQLFNRIPNNIRASVLTQIAQVAKQKLDKEHKNNKNSAWPFD